MRLLLNKGCHLNLGIVSRQTKNMYLLMEADVCMLPRGGAPRMAPLLTMAATLGKPGEVSL